MDKLRLIVVMPTRKIYEGDADRVMVRTAGGDVAILPRHMDYAAVLGSGDARITINGKPRPARINGGMLHVSRNCVRILTDDFEWQDE